MATRLNWVGRTNPTGSEIVWCDARKLDRNWRWSTDQYVAPHLVNTWYGDAGRYAMVDARMPAGLPCDIADAGFADIEITEQLGGKRAFYDDGDRPAKVLGFSDGRHRVRWSIDNGVLTIPIYFRGSDVALARELMGSDFAVSILPTDYRRIAAAGLAEATARPPVMVEMIGWAGPQPEAGYVDTSKVPPVGGTWFERLFAWLESRR